MPPKCIYRKASKGKKQKGQVTDIQIGDAVTFRDSAGWDALCVVEKIDGVAKVIWTEPTVHEGVTLRPATKVAFDQIVAVARLPEPHPLVVEYPKVVAKVKGPAIRK